MQALCRLHAPLRRPYYSTCSVYGDKPKLEGQQEKTLVRKPRLRERFAQLRANPLEEAILA